MILSILAVSLSFGMILLGNALEGGHLASLTQPTAALIVLGGTLGAVVLGCTGEEIVGAIKSIPKIFFGGAAKKTDVLIAELIDLANIARKEGILALDARLNTIKNPFLVNYLRKVIDGYDPNVLKELMEDKLILEEEEQNAIGQVWTDAGAYSPTVGIIGAVLGLIHVMSNLDDPSKLGSGIAVAFVATIYGVGLANLLFFPFAKKIKKLTRADMVEYQLMVTAILGIQAGLNPRVIEDQLLNVLGEYGADEGEGGGSVKKAA